MSNHTMIICWCWVFFWEREKALVLMTERKPSSVKCTYSELLLAIILLLNLILEMWVAESVWDVFPFK